MRLRYSERIASDLSQTLGYIRLKSHSTAARNVAADIRFTLERIRQMPLSGRLQEDGVSRKAITRRYKYLIFYAQFEAGIVDILTIQSPAKDRGFKDA